ncbi:PIN domain-containing protein [Amylibacter sp. SFDW26]|uniref:RSP_2648 family PIN domain-containing protein n=1 Tax=Amylibacter sp. SFDW26 TaxID=2652722 RepID=UPI0012625F6D|nr:PIN domain-containing protein [Amylibacter sp. SFDW26]KAB7610296.1 PIN domain-containing protein [Amylibacter sp. SFDW26]
MRIVLDACVLYPTVMREVLLGAAKKGAFDPIWSARLLEEWRRAAVRHGKDQAQVAGVEIALLKANWPKAEIASVHVENLWLPDENDIHVLETAITAEAGAILTVNIKDFPTRVLSNHSILRRDPDNFLVEFAQEHPNAMIDVANEIKHAAELHSGEPKDIRKLLKRTGLPRLGKLLATQS